MGVMLPDSGRRGIGGHGATPRGRGIIGGFRRNAAMLKFRCQHCGQRIAVPARHLGKLVLCSECGEQTHPLAAQLVKKAAPAAAGRAARGSQPVPAGGCANCGGIIGRLQSSHEWESQRVCGACYHVLSGESSRLRVAPAMQHPAPALVTRVASSVAPELGTALLTARERVARAVVVFVVGAVALYGALTLLRDIAGLIAVAAVAVLALLALYAIFRARVGPRFKSGPLNVPADTVHPPETVLLTMRAR
jgi:predicted RNA-binding Zn-ribbon protein involved in translation (DUF1610 family)